MLHLNNNETRAPRGQPEYDALHKVKPILDELTSKFQNIYTSEENLTIDEGICAFHGRVFFRVYMKGKPHKYGIKIYELCEAKSGFVSNMEVYAGAIPTDKDHNTPFNVVNRLSEPVRHKWHTVYMDRYFSSPSLFDHLWANEIKAVGTVMANRKEMPKQQFAEKIRKGEKLSAQRGQLLAIKWSNVRDLYILSTAHEDSMVYTPRARG